MIAPRLLFAIISPPTPWDTIAVLVFAGSVLAALWVIFNRQNALDKRLRELEAPQTTPAPSPTIAASASPAAQTNHSSESSPNDFIFIAAAVHLALGARHRIVAVKPPIADNLHWSLEGRRQVFQSHKVR